MKVYYANIVYDVDAITTNYVGIIVTDRNDFTIAAFCTGNPILDHKSYVQWVASLVQFIDDKEISARVVECSSFNHWYQDVPGFKEIIGDDNFPCMVYDVADDRTRLGLGHPSVDSLVLQDPTLTGEHYD